MAEAIHERAEARPELDRHALLGAALVLAASAGFGANTIFVKLAYAHGIGLGTIIAVRFVVAAAVVAPLAALTLRRERRSARTIAGWFVVSAVYAVSLVSYWESLKLAHVSQVAPLVFLYPALVGLLGRAVFHETLDRARIVAITCGIAGCVLIVGVAVAPARAAALALVTAVACAVYFIGASRAVAPGDWMPATATIFVTGGLVSVPLLVGGGFDTPHGRTWLFLGGIAVVGTLLPFPSFIVGVLRIGSTRAAILSTLEPVVVVALALTVLHEHVTIAQGAGIVLILASFLAAALPDRKGSEAAAPNLGP
jgi:drug/metabolite transporter (DMT)-like permease